MDIEILEEKIKKIEDEFEKLKKEESYKIEKIKNEIKLLDINTKELNKKKIMKCIECNNRSFQKKIKEKNSSSKRTKFIKDVKKEMFFELRMLKNEKEKKKTNFLNKKYKYLKIYEITNEIKHNFLELNIRRQFLFKSIIEKLTKYKNRSLHFFNKYLNIQKEINSLFELISNNALIDIFVLSKNSSFFQNQLLKNFQRFYYQVENSLVE
ncbi:conserved Plasmodium protein, unknown function [Plasmodium gallinaceum]|uniref:Uncharacterized protein n=1 Tax=Plasmodium gallinaceum TaxID=5849 RepID=A0A1J1GWM5_PLAGA|nr:conserved Plasmodium protein, unknown function [Plasmodium gallinaceum]CRG95709.1 conserved Plasmodium protein, unknown function [Plasmodium gallinaceum]